MSSLLLISSGLALAKPGYRSRGWRPKGQPFNSDESQSHLYGPPPPVVASIPTTTPRYREPTTPITTIHQLGDEDLEAASPALAIANSYAFNRPVYVYNGFPFYPTYTILQ